MSSVLDSTFGPGFSGINWELYQDESAEAQKLLADALAANARMQNTGIRFEEGEKRKLQDFAEDGTLAENTPSKSSHNEYHDSIVHDDDDDDSVDHDNSKRIPKKPGRKPLANTPLTVSDPKQKRKAQNRAAQRAFRERKERYVKELEDRIRELETNPNQPASHLQAENAQLKSLVQKLETENYILKGANLNFGFDFSLKDASQNVRDPWTPPSSGGSDHGHNDSEPNSPTDSGISGSPSSIQQSSEKSPSDAPISTPVDLQTPILDINSPVQPVKDEINSDELGLLSDSIFPLGYSEGQTEKPMSLAFTEYREPSPYHNPFSDSAPIPPLFQHEFDDYGSFSPMLTPATERNEDALLAATAMGPVSIIPQTTPEQLSPTSPPLSFAPSPARFEHKPAPNTENKKMLPFAKAWESISEHPKFDEFDLDQLCEEMKAKAKCSGHGRAVEEEDVKKMLKKMDEK